MSDETTYPDNEAAWACESADHAGKIVIFLAIPGGAYERCPICQLSVMEDEVRAFHLDPAIQVLAPIIMTGTMEEAMHAFADDRAEPAPVSPLFQVVGTGTYDQAADKIIRGRWEPTPEQQAILDSHLDEDDASIIRGGMVRLVTEAQPVVTSSDALVLSYGGFSIRAYDERYLDEASDVAVELLASAGYGPDEVIEYRGDHLDVISAQTLIEMGYLLGMRANDPDHRTDDYPGPYQFGEGPSGD